MTTITSIAALEAIYGQTNKASTVKEVDHVTPEYATYIENSPFAALATAGPEGLDCSPRGGPPGFVRLHDSRTLMMPDRRGNNRCDSLRNIVRDPRAAMLFLVPGSGNTLRVNGLASVETDPALLNRFAVEDAAPRSVIVLRTQAVYFQCARALVRSDLWNPAGHAAPDSLPTAGQMLAALSGGEVGGADYDREWPERAARTMW